MITMPRTYAVCALAAAATLSLAACGGSGSGSASSTAAAAGSATFPGGGQGQGGFAGRTPGVNGLIAAVDASTIQVQTRTDQTAVTWSSATKITAEVTVPSSTVKVGDCVMARPAVGAGAGSQANGGATAAPATVAAATVLIISTGGTGCTFGGARGAGVAGAGAGAGQPTGAPSGAGTRTGGFGGNRGGGAGAAGFGAIGRVASLGIGTFTVTEPAFAGLRGASATASPSATVAPRAITVTYTATTRFTTRKAATANAIKVGECVTAQGKADDTGSVAATALALSPATNGQCSGGFGRA